jgi:hypothetical protein
MASAMSLIRTPPSYCQYSGGPCDQSFSDVPEREGLFLYASEPASISDAIEAAVTKAQATGIGHSWTTWRDLPIAGRIIFCEVGKAMRYSGTVIADVTTLNFNLMFEIGYAIGLGLPIVPIRDTSYVSDKRAFEELGVLDTLGFVDFTNADNLLGQLKSRLPAQPFHHLDEEIAFDAPLYVIPGNVTTEGDIRLMSAIKKSRIKFRTFDASESPRLSLAEAHRQVSRSVGVITHLLSPNRRGSVVHNALCALLGGMAMAQQKVLLMLQEERIQQPIDYRDVVRGYGRIEEIVGLIEDPLSRIFQEIQSRRSPGRPRPANILQQIDLGDTAAENESSSLDDYFVETGQYIQARQGHARLVIGRKGTGKTAIFYGIRNPLIQSPSRLIMDLRPEGYQFTKLREFLLTKLTQGVQEHTMSAFWHLLLLTEMARKILVADRHFANRDPERFQRFQAVEEAYRGFNPDFEADFSQRLMTEVDRILERADALSPDDLGPRLTQHLFTGDVRHLGEVIVDYLRAKDEVWLLVDNLDKGWPIHGSTDEDILIVRALLEATRKLQGIFDDERVQLKCLVFLRTDIFAHLQQTTPDKGKDTAISLTWDDVALFEEVIGRRIAASTGLEGEFRDLWGHVCDSLIAVEDTFSYMVDRTLMRPRDLLVFLRRCVEVAINRGHDRIEVEDILIGERAYSEDILLGIAYEISDTRPEWGDVLYAFQGAATTLERGEVEARLREARPEIDGDEAQEGIDLLMRFGFLGVRAPGFDDAAYSHTVSFNMQRLWEPINRGKGVFVIHPAFHEALGTKRSGTS